MNVPNQNIRVVLVSGAAGGLGQGLLREFTVQGWQVAAGFHQTKPTIQSESIWPVPLDVTQLASVQDAVRQVLDRWGRLDVLINNAGITRDQPLWKMNTADWDQVLAVNLKGAALCAQAVLPVMFRQREGHIINLSSFSGRAGARGQANYAAAKAGLLGLTQALAKEAGRRNIRVNAVLPGVLPTALTAQLKSEQLKSFADANVLGRINSIAEVARFTAFLATLQNVSGQLFQLDSRIARWT